MTSIEVKIKSLQKAMYENKIDINFFNNQMEMLLVAKARQSVDNVHFYERTPKENTKGYPYVIQKRQRNK